MVPLHLVVPMAKDIGEWELIGLGALAIVNLSSTRHQPMLSSDHRCIFTTSGGIYNFRELRPEFESKVYWFRSKTDSDVALTALVEWVRKAFLKFNVKFTLAFWIRIVRLLGRATIGEKAFVEIEAVIMKSIPGNIAVAGHSEKILSTLKS